MVEITSMRSEYLEPVLQMWHDLLILTSEVNPWYRLSPDAVEIQRRVFEKESNNQSSFCLVATQDEKPIGFANGFLILPSRIFQTKTIGLIENLFVLPDVRRQGGGGRLVDACYNWFSDNFIDQVYVNVVPHNQLSIRFWKSKGYQIHKVTMARNL